MLDMTLLQLLRKREEYNKLIGAVPLHAMDDKTRTILEDYGRFFRAYPDVPEAGPDFWGTFFATAHPKLSDEARALYKKLGQQAQESPEPGAVSGLRSRLVATDVASKLLTLIEEFQEGAEVDVYSRLRAAVEYFEKETDRKVKTPWVKPTADSMFEDDRDDIGLHWRIDCLNNSMRPLRPGDFGIIAARPDRGKTTFLTDQLTFMSEQLVRMDKGPIIWFNNEGKGARIYDRLVMSALNKTVDDLAGMGRGAWLPQYLTLVGGVDVWDRIRIMDIHDYWHHEVEDIIKDQKPGLVVFDMIDNIRFGGDVGNNGQRTDQLLEAMYQWARVLGVKYDHPVLATSQISADGDGEIWPTLGQLKDSKTGKQGAADFILTLGASNDPSLASQRFLGMTKNKLRRSKGKKSPQTEVYFDELRGRYVEP